MSGNMFSTMTIQSRDRKFRIPRNDFVSWNTLLYMQVPPVYRELFRDSSFKRHFGLTVNNSKCAMQLYFMYAVFILIQFQKIAAPAPIYKCDSADIFLGKDYQLRQQVHRKYNISLQVSYCFSMPGNDGRHKAPHHIPSPYANCNPNYNSIP